MLKMYVRICMASSRKKGGEGMYDKINAETYPTYAYVLLQPRQQCCRAQPSQVVIHASRKNNASKHEKVTLYSAAAATFSCAGPILG